MWPLCFLLNKILKPEEQKESDGVVSNETPTCLFEFSLSCEKSNEGALARSRFVEVPHINQLHYWDCGLACVLMVLKTVGINDCPMQALAELCNTTSIWTVDLAYLLQKFSVSFSYFTVTFGANPNYSVETFYKEQLANDLLRVDTLFQRAVEIGIRIVCRSISKEHLSLLILSGKYIAIVLVDQYKLSPSWLEDVFVSGFCGSNSGYTGHYVVICGYDADDDEFEIRDPARSRKHERVTSQCLEEARKCFGTDEDLILVSLEKSDKQHLSPNVKIAS